MGKIKNVKVGDLFQFKVSDAGFALGQVLIANTLQYICIFEPIYPTQNAPHKLCRGNILLSGWTTDARFFSGDWTIVGNLQVNSDISYPEYKVGYGSDCRITDVTGNFLRQANEGEEQSLRFKTTHSPIAYEKAFRAHHFGNWESRFDELVYEAR